MSGVSVINSERNHWLTKQVFTSALGVTVASVSNVAHQFFFSSASNFIGLPPFIKNVVWYGCGAGTVVGAVIGIYSAVRLCQTIISERNERHKAVAATAGGVLFTSLVQAAGQHFWEIAPSFRYLGGHSLAYCIGTNLAWHACAISGIAGIIFTGYAAYRVGKAILNAMNQPIVATSTN